MRGANVGGVIEKGSTDEAWMRDFYSDIFIIAIILT